MSRSRALSVVALLLSAVSVVCGDDQPSHRSLRGRQTAAGVELKIPKLLHFSAYGDAIPEYMSVMMDWSIEKAKNDGFDVMIWRDQDAEALVKQMSSAIPGLAESWEHVKADTSIGAMAKRADFMRPLIMYELGGIYSDSDMIPCGGYEYMVKTPGVVTFPEAAKQCCGGKGHLNGAIWSAPPKHRLPQLAMEYFISLGSEITTLDNLAAAGPFAFAIVGDMYFKEIGAGVPPMSAGKDFYAEHPFTYSDHTDSAHPYPGEWTQIADIRFGKGTPGFHHLSQSWGAGKAHEETMSSPLVEDLSMTKPYLNMLCLF